MPDHRSASRSLYRSVAILLLLVLLGASLPMPSASAQQAARYFPETGHWLRGAFRSYWERNGATQLFGYPLTEEYRRSDGRIVQWFERARFELASANPVLIELGRVGVEATAGRDFPKVAPFKTDKGRRYFPETGHSLKGLFRTSWETRGGVRIFGFPISEELTEPINGQNTLVQYFERARFELRLNPSRVEFGQLARPMTPPQLLAPWPPNVLPPGPLNEDGTPRPPTPGMAIRVNPGTLFPGQSALVQGEGFASNENVSLWLSGPDRSTRALGVISADPNGSISSAQIGFTVDGSFALGLWNITAHGQASGREVVAQFTIQLPPGNPATLGNMVHPHLRPSGDGSMTPLAAPAEIAFTVTARGFAGDERIGLWLTRPDGDVVTLDPIARIDGRGTVTATFKVPSAHEGAWAVTAEGVNTKRRVIVPFKVTREFLAPLGTARPANRNGGVSPAEGGRGTSFRISATGFRANETLEFWITSPDGLYVLATPVVADSRGRVGVSRSLSVQLGAQNATGVYGYHYRGVRSGVRADVYFTYTGRLCIERLAMSFDESRFRQVLGYFASGVTVVTTAHNGQLYGMTVSSFSSLSLNPPLVLICVDTSLPTHNALQDAQHFAINILSKQQEHLSRRFATRDLDKFQGIAYTLGQLKAPVLDGALAVIECRVHATLPGGDHTIFVGEVIDAQISEGVPLLYYRRGYHSLS